jgi:predicted nucleic acid-binding protein
MSLLNREQRVACDTGPILALINRRDQFHQSCTEAVQTVPFPMFTVWPVIVEAYYLIQRYGGPAEVVLHWIQARHLRVMELRQADIQRIRHLTRKYRELPMDLADAALVAACEREKVRRVFTLDRKDFLIYRPSHIERFELLP